MTLTANKFIIPNGVPVGGKQKMQSSSYGVNDILDHRIIVNQENMSDTLGSTIDSDKEYFLDGVIDLGTTQITVPSTGITIRGLGFDISGLLSTENSYTMFVDSGGAGNVLMEDIDISVTGTSSQVYDLTDATGFNAVEIGRVNYTDCTSLGTLNGYRQGLEVGTGRFGGSPTLTLSGTWLGGFRITTSIVRSLSAGMTGSLFEEGTSFTMASRFLTDMNCDLPTSASLIDFQPSNFVNPSLLQFDGTIITRDGVQDSEDSNLTPNIEPSDLVCSWKNNKGLKNTFEGGVNTVTSEVTTTISTQDVYVDLAGTFTPSDLQHFDEPSEGQLRHLGLNPVEYVVVSEFIIEGGSNDDVTLRLSKWDDSGSSWSEVATQLRPINNLAGGRNVGFYLMISPVTLNQNDKIKFEVANNSDTTNVTAETSSFYNISER